MNEDLLFESPEDYYLLRGRSSYERVGESSAKTLLEQYNLKEPFDKLTKMDIPLTYNHFLKGVLMPGDEKPRKGDLLKLLDSVPFERPIQTFSSDTLRAAFTLQPVTKHHSVQLKEKKKSLIPSTEEASKTTEDRAKQEKKERKRKKREKEEYEELQIVFRGIIHKLKNMVWNTWMINGKPSNPFLQKITKQNCQRLGVPNYFDFISTPMDLSTMKDKADKGVYRHVDQFKKDLYLVVENAKLFNRQGEPVHQMAIDLGESYEAQMKEALENLQNERKKKKKEKKKKKDKKKDKS